MNTIRELFGLTTKEFNMFRNDPTNHSVLQKAIMELDYSCLVLKDCFTPLRIGI